MLVSARSGKIYTEQSKQLERLRSFQRALVETQAELMDNPNSSRLKGDKVYLEMTIARRDRELTKWMVATLLLGSTIYVSEHEELLDGPPVTFL